MIMLSYFFEIRALKQLFVLCRAWIYATVYALPYQSVVQLLCWTGYSSILCSAHGTANHMYHIYIVHRIGRLYRLIPSNYHPLTSTSNISMLTENCLDTFTFFFFFFLCSRQSILHVRHFFSLSFSSRCISSSIYAHVFLIVLNAKNKRLQFYNATASSKQKGIYIMSNVWYGYNLQLQRTNCVIKVKCWIEFEKKI